MAPRRRDAVLTSKPCSRPPISARSQGDMGSEHTRSVRRHDTKQGTIPQILLWAFPSGGKVYRSAMRRERKPTVTGVIPQVTHSRGTIRREPPPSAVRQSRASTARALDTTPCLWRRTSLCTNRIRASHPTEATAPTPHRNVSRDGCLPALNLDVRRACPRGPSQPPRRRQRRCADTLRCKVSSSPDGGISRPDD